MLPLWINKAAKNGRMATGQQKFHCIQCNAYGTLDRKDAERAHQEAMVLRLYQERVSQRAIVRITTVSRMTVAKILKKSFRPIGDTIRPLTERSILELDELWSCVGSKANPVWIWLALEQQPRRVVGFAMGDRSADTGRRLWASLPADDRKRAVCFSDFWSAYPAFLPLL